MIGLIFMNFLCVKFIISSYADQISVGFFLLYTFLSQISKNWKKKFFCNVLNNKNNLLFT